jgi:hypothetical protein
MNQSFGSWMLTGGLRGEVHEDARRMEHLRAIHELQSERTVTRRSARNAAIVDVVSGLRARFAGAPSQTTPDCCPA